MAFSQGLSNNRTSFIRSFGKTNYLSQGLDITEEVFFDLASLTKPLATTLCIITLIEKGIIDWNDKIEKFFNLDKNEEKRNITIENLLSHSSGFIPYRPYYKNYKPIIDINNEKKIIDSILNESLYYKTGEKCSYSDLGYIILGKIIEIVSETRLDKFYINNITKPADIEKDIFFNPVLEKKENKVFVATEKCEWRNKIIQGEVHDENSWLLNGISGHAGLFAKTRGVLKLCEIILDKWLDKEVKELNFSNKILQIALKRKNIKETWSCGFDSPSPSGSSAGTMISKQSRGHLGFTGTSFWIDPKKQIIMILLTNRVHPTRDNKLIKDFRPKFHDTVISNVF